MLLHTHSLKSTLRQVQSYPPEWPQRLVVKIMASYPPLFTENRLAPQGRPHKAKVVSPQRLKYKSYTSTITLGTTYCIASVGVRPFQTSHTHLNNVTRKPAEFFFDFTLTLFLKLADHLLTWKTICHTTTTILMAVSGSTFISEFWNETHFRWIEIRRAPAPLPSLSATLPRCFKSTATTTTTTTKVATASPTAERLVSSEHFPHRYAILGEKRSAHTAQSERAAGKRGG